MAKKPLTQAEIQHQQLLEVFNAVGGSHFGHYLGFNKLSRKELSTLDKAHIKLTEATEVLAHSPFTDLVRGIAGGDDNQDMAELFLTPDLMTSEPLAGVCTLEESSSKSLPLTRRQLENMRAHRQQHLDKVAEKHKVKNPQASVYFYNNPVVNILTENRVWFTGIDSLLSRPEKKGLFRKSVPEPVPELGQFNRQEKRLGNFIGIYADAIEKHPETEIIYAQPYHFSDVGHQLRVAHERNIRLAEIAPELKAVMLDVTAYSCHEVGVRHFLQSHNATVYTHMYRPEGMFGAGVAPQETPTVIKPVLDGGAFYEFIPLSQFNPVKGTLKADHQRLSVEKVEEGQKYVAVLSTIAGVVGFNTRTIVRVVQKDPLLLEIIGQIGALDHQGQMLTNEQSDKMVVKLNKTITRPYQFYIRHYMVGDHRDQEQLVWALELSRPPKSVSVQVLRGIANSIHGSLVKENQLYRRTYERPALSPPIFVFLPPGTFLEGNQSGAKRLDYADDSHLVRQLIHLAGDRTVKIRAARISADS